MQKTNKILVTLSIVLALLSRGDPIFSQTVMPVVVASTGSDTTIGNTAISYTVGETSIQTLSTGNNYLAQGFHQPDWLMVGIPEVMEDDIRVYPNPTPGLVNVVIGHQQMTATVYDINGKVVVQAQNISGSTQIDLATLAPAHYLMTLQNATKRYSIKLIKIN